MSDIDNFLGSAANDSVQIVSFNVDEEEYGIPIEDIQRVIRLPEITRLPQTPDFIKGVINLEGEVVPIIDMHERFGLEKREYGTSTRVIIVKLMEKDVGMIVDSVSQVRVVMNKEIEKVTEVISGISKEYIAGIAKISDSMVILLKIEKILTSKEFTVVSKAGKGKKTKK